MSTHAYNTIVANNDCTHAILSPVVIVVLCFVDVVVGTACGLCLCVCSVSCCATLEIDATFYVSPFFSSLAIALPVSYTWSSTAARRWCGPIWSNAITHRIVSIDYEGSLRAAPSRSSISVLRRTCGVTSVLTALG